MATGFTFEELLEKRRQMERTLEGLHRGAAEVADFKPEPVLVDGSPVCDLYIDKGVVYLDVELPGVPEDAIEVTAEGAQVRIQGHHPAAAEVEAVIRKNRRRGPFNYRFLLPDGMEVSHYESLARRGVLHLKLHVARAGAPAPAADPDTTPDAT